MSFRGRQSLHSTCTLSLLRGSVLAPRLTNDLLHRYLFFTKMFGTEAVSVSFRGRQMIYYIFSFSPLRGSILAPAFQPVILHPLLFCMDD